MMSRRGKSGNVRLRFPSFLPSSLREKMATVCSLLQIDTRTLPPNGGTFRLLWAGPR